MEHKHGNEYQIRIVRKDGTEKLSDWMNSIEEVAQAMILAHMQKGTTCRLLVRSIICHNCPDKKQLLEYPIMDVPTLRYIPHDSRLFRYLFYYPS